MNKLEIKPTYEHYTLDQSFTTKKLFFLLYFPVPVSAYQKFKNEYLAKGNTIDWNIGMIEEPKLLGNSWMGLADVNGNKKVSGDFVAYKMVGDYKQFRTVWPQIMKDYPKIKEGYHIYKTDPAITKMEDNITYIIFR